MSDVNQTYDPNQQPAPVPYTPPGAAAPPFFAPLADPAAPRALSEEEIAAHHTAAEEEYLDNLYAELKPQAVSQYIEFFLARTPAHLQDDMKELIKGDLAIPPEQPALATTEEQRAGVVQAGPGVHPAAPQPDPRADARRRARDEAARQNPDDNAARRDPAAPVGHYDPGPR